MSDRTTRVALGGDGIDLAAGLLAPRLVSRTASRAEVALLATTATLLGGDHVRIELAVAAGHTLVVTDVAGTVAYDGRGAAARWDVALTVGSGATLIWHGEPLVVSDGADVRRTLTGAVADGGRLLLRDTVALGRIGQDGGRLTCRTRLSLTGVPAVVEDLALDADLAPGLLGAARVVDSVTALGWRPAPAASSYSLAVDGALHRDLVAAGHESSAAAVWASWRTALGDA